MVLLWARCINVFLRSALQFWLVKYIISLGYTNKPLTTFVFAYMITCNPLIGNLIGAKLSGLFGGYKKKNLLYMYLYGKLLLALHLLQHHILKNGGNSVFLLQCIKF